MTKGLINVLLSAESEGFTPVAVDTDLLDGIDDTETELAQDVIADANAQSESSLEVGTAIDAVDELGGLQATLEGICVERLPTKHELQLISSRHVKIMQKFEVEVVGYSQESDDLEFAATLTRESLTESISKIGSAIANAFKTLCDNLAQLWKKFVFFCKTATSQVTQFESELARFNGTPKFDKIRLTTPTASYSGLGNAGVPADIIRQCEKTNGYVYSDLYFKMATYAVNGGKPPEVQLEPFDGLPNEPRFRFEADHAFFIENPPRPRDTTVDLPSVETLKAWCRAFIEESMHFIRNYEAFKSLSEKVYEEMQEAIEDEDTDVMMDSAKKILFARSHSCIESMEAWVRYVIRLMYAHHTALMTARKAFV